jgi:adenylate cyclase
MGDGLLAIFRDRGDDTGGAAQSALTGRDPGADCASRPRTGRALRRADRRRHRAHHGEAAYGNVGSGSRLDFTVIGRDVNLASRIARLNKTLREPLLMSKPFVEHLWGNPESLGLQTVDGFEEPIAVYRPAL